MFVLAGPLAVESLMASPIFLKGDDRQMPEESQMSPMDNAQIDKYAVSFQIANSGGNSEACVVSYNPDQKQFSLLGVNTTTGRVDGFQNVSQTEMARNILSTNPNENLKSMLSRGPATLF